MNTGSEQLGLIKSLPYRLQSSQEFSEHEVARTLLVTAGQRGLSAAAGSLPRIMLERDRTRRGSVTAVMKQLLKFALTVLTSQDVQTSHRR